MFEHLRATHLELAIGYSGIKKVQESRRINLSMVLTRFACP